MTDHPITPPPELVEQWYEDGPGDQRELVEYVATQAARWGADQELEACCAWLSNHNWRSVEPALRAARRRPPTLKEQALKAQQRMWNGTSNHDDWNLVRRALEELPE